MQPLSEWKRIKYYILWVCLCRLSYPERNAHAPYFDISPLRLYNILSPLRLYNISPHCLVNERFFEKETPLIGKCVLILSIIFVWNIYCTKKNWARCDQKRVLVFMWSSRYSCQLVMKLKFYPQILEKILKYQISWNPVQWEPSSLRTADGEKWRS